MSPLSAKKPKETSGYEDIANEYYDSARHPTCANLRFLSLKYITPRIPPPRLEENLLVEVGAGRSMLAQWRSDNKSSLENVILIDSSESMLSYSIEWERLGAQLRIADATATGLEDSSVDVLVASLGDPYNILEFWKEAARIIRPTGICLFTTPAAEWAYTFRAKDELNVAAFLREDGANLLMPSPVWSDEEQAALFEAAGFQIADEAAFTRLDLTSRVAPKLLCVGDTVPLLRGYSLRPI